MKTVKGDLIKLALNGEFDVIVHGCNCFCTMGSGIAAGIKKHFPEAYEEDCSTEKGAEDKLGTTSFIHTNGVIVVNGYTQYHWSKIGPKGQKSRYNSKEPLVSYDALRLVFREVKNYFGGMKIGYPMIGAGLARGEWDVISKIIDEELEGEDHTLVIYKP